MLGVVVRPEMADTVCRSRIDLQLGVKTVLDPAGRHEEGIVNERVVRSHGEERGWQAREVGIERADVRRSRGSEGWVRDEFLRKPLRRA